MMNKITIYLIILFYAFNIKAQNNKPILFLGATTHIGNGKKIQNSAISIVDGKIDIVANASMIRIDSTAFDTIFKLYDKHIYPGFIVPNTTLGITEIDAVRASNDYRETGNINPNVRALIAYNTDSRISKTVRSNGVLLAQVTPRGGLVSGQSSVMYLDGWNWEDAVCRSDDGIHINWPTSYYQSGWWGEPGEVKQDKEYADKKNELYNLFKKANSYNKKSQIFDLKLESMKGLFNSTKILYIHSDNASDMLDAIDFSNYFKIKKIVIVGGEDALKIVDVLKQNNIPIILNRVHRLPEKEDSHIDAPFTQPAELEKAGVLFCLSYSGDMEAMGSRNLPFTAGTAVAYGLDYEKAISSITLNTAKILGIDHKCGSIEKGRKQLSLLVLGMLLI